jgi:hypothetical protein
MGARHDIAANDNDRPACLECGGRTRLVPVRQAFPHLRVKPRSPVAWLCDCGAAVTCHAGSTRAIGAAASSATAAARIAGHHALDAAIRAGAFGPRVRAADRAYAWLGERLGLAAPFHFGHADLALCERACHALRDLTAPRVARPPR